jgi:hypothetical protein
MHFCRLEVGIIYGHNNRNRTTVPKIFILTLLPMGVHVQVES